MDEIIFFHKRKFYEVDPRIKFLIGFIGSIFMLFIKSEPTLLLTFILGILWCIYCGKWKNATFIAVLYGLLYLWTLSMLNAPEQASNGFIVITVLLRRFLLIGAFVTPLASVEVGALVSALKKMKVPKMITMSVAILFRFIPTLQEEYRSVRTSQKIRGIGRTIFNVIAHPITFYETLIVPFAIRIMRVSDELSASAILRGADKAGSNTSFSDVKITFSDTIIFILFIIGIICFALMNYGVIFGGIK